MQHSQLIWRILLATVGSFTLVSLLCVTITRVLFVVFGVNQAQTFIWCMLLGLVVYALLVMWIFATRSLIRTSATFILGSVMCWLFIYSGVGT